MATGVHEPDRGAYALGRYRGVRTAARPQSVALQARPAGGKAPTHGTADTAPVVNKRMQEAHRMRGVLETSPPSGQGPVPQHDQTSGKGGISSRKLSSSVPRITKGDPCAPPASAKQSAPHDPRRAGRGRRAPC